jgi:hypothetical protein
MLEFSIAILESTFFVATTCVGISADASNMHLLQLTAATAAGVAAVTGREVVPPSPDQAVVTAHVAATGNQTFRAASGELKFPYLVPAGPYNQVTARVCRGAA